MAKQLAVTFTESEIDHLLTVMSDASHDGSYYGNREQYWRRHSRIVCKLLESAAPRGGQEQGA